MNNKCGCNPIQEPFEFPLIDCPDKIIKGKFGELFPLDIDIEKLKTRLICEYQEIIDKLECGIRIDLEPFLEILSLIYIREKIFQDNTIYMASTTYYGFSLEENPENLDLSLLQKYNSDSLKMTNNIENTIYGSYLWIVSPFILNKVATDEGFTFGVKMLPVSEKNGLHYYRSSSKIDICNLTYYIR